MKETHKHVFIKRHEGVQVVITLNLYITLHTMYKHNARKEKEWKSDFNDTEYNFDIWMTAVHFSNARGFILITQCSLSIFPSRTHTNKIDFYYFTWYYHFFLGEGQWHHQPCQVFSGKFTFSQIWCLSK